MYSSTSPSKTSRPAILGGSPAVNLPFPKDWPKIGPQEIAAVVDLLERKVLSIYDRSGVIAEFEDAFARYHGVEYALTHNAGTSALHAAFFAVGIGPGDEVIAPTYTFLATVVPILQCNGIPVLCDMEADTLTIDPESVRRNITRRTRAIVVTHVWGHPVEMDEIMAIARQYNLRVIEDCSHAHGATYRGQKVGTIGDIGAFSLEGHKPITAGEGGMFITNNRDYYERALLLGHFGDRAEQEVRLPHNRRYVTTGFGHKYRMHPLGAAIANSQLPHLDEWNEMRRANLDTLSGLLQSTPGIFPPVTRAYVTRGGYYGYKPQYNAAVFDGMPMDLYLKAVRAEGVRIKRPDSAPLHLQALFQAGEDRLFHHSCPWECPHAERNVVYKPGDLPVAEQVFERLMSMPTFTDPATALLDQYALAFEKVAAHAGEIAQLWKDNQFPA